MNTLWNCVTFLPCLRYFSNKSSQSKNIVKKKPKHLLKWKEAHDILHEKRRLQKRMWRIFSSFCVYVCIERRQTHEKMLVWLWMFRLQCLFIFSCLADQHFLQGPNSNYIIWGKRTFLNLAASNMFRALFFPAFFFFFFQPGRGWSFSLQHLMNKDYGGFCFPGFSDGIIFLTSSQRIIESSMAEQLSLTTSNCRTPRE